MARRNAVPEAPISAEMTQLIRSREAANSLLGNEAVEELLDVDTHPARKHQVGHDVPARR